MAAYSTDSGIVNYYIFGNQNGVSTWYGKDTTIRKSKYTDAIIVAFELYINTTIYDDNVELEFTYKTPTNEIVHIDAIDFYDELRPLLQEDATNNNVNKVSSNTTTSNGIYKQYYLFIPNSNVGYHQQNTDRLTKSSTYSITAKISVKQKYRFDRDIFTQTIDAMTSDNDAYHFFISDVVTDYAFETKNTYNVRVKKDVVKYQNGLYSLITPIIDTSPSSPNYFRITKCDDELMLGMSDFHFHLNPLYFKSEYPVYIELLDYNGNPVYYEVANERNNMYNNTYIVFYVTSDTAQGPATLTLAGHVNADIDGNLYDDYEYINIKWVHTLYINPNKINNSDIIFNNTPIVRKIDNITRNPYTTLHSKQSSIISELFGVKTYNHVNIPLNTIKQDVLAEAYIQSTNHTGSFTFRYDNVSNEYIISNADDSHPNIYSSSINDNIENILPSAFSGISYNVYIQDESATTSDYIAIQSSSYTSFYVNNTTIPPTINRDVEYGYQYKYVDNAATYSTTSSYISASISTNDARKIYNFSWAERKLESYFPTAQSTPNQYRATISDATDSFNDGSVMISLLNNRSISIKKSELIQVYGFNNTDISNIDNNTIVYKNNNIINITQKSFDTLSLLGTIQTTNVSGYFIKNNDETNEYEWIEILYDTTTSSTDTNVISILYRKAFPIRSSASHIPDYYDLVYMNISDIIDNISDITLCIMQQSQQIDDCTNYTLTNCYYDYDVNNNVSKLTFTLKNVVSGSINILDNIYSNDTFIEVPAVSFTENNTYTDANIHLPIAQLNSTSNKSIQIAELNSNILNGLCDYEICMYSNSYLVYNILNTIENNTTLIDTYIPTHLDIVNPNCINAAIVYLDDSIDVESKISQEYITFEITNFMPMQGYIDSINCYWRDNRFDWIVVQNNSNTNTLNNISYIPQYHLLDKIDISSTYPTSNSKLDYNYGIGYNYNEIRFQVRLPQHISTADSDIPCTIDYKFEFVNAYGKKCITDVAYIGDTYTI